VPTWTVPAYAGFEAVAIPLSEWPSRWLPGVKSDDVRVGLNWAGPNAMGFDVELQRARAGMREHLPAERQDWTGGEEDAGTRELVRRYTDPSVATDVDGLGALLRNDVRCSMPPTPGLYVGRDTVVNDWVESGFEDLGHLRGVLTFVNRQPAVAFYLWRKQEDAYLPLTIDVLRITGGAITEILTFHDDQFPRLGLPERLPADDTE
jgi:ketosteroid isomerase-like protein